MTFLPLLWPSIFFGCVNKRERNIEDIYIQFNAVRGGWVVRGAGGGVGGGGGLWWWGGGWVGGLGGGGGGVGGGVGGGAGGRGGGGGGGGWGRGDGGSRRRGLVVRDVGTLCFLMEWNERRWDEMGRTEEVLFILPFFLCWLADRYYLTLPHLVGFLYATHQILTSLLFHFRAWAT